MKRNKESRRTMRHKRAATLFTLGTSRYARKAKRGDQMYGDGTKWHGGCCAHGVFSPLQPKGVAA